MVCIVQRELGFTELTIQILPEDCNDVFVLKHVHFALDPMLDAR